MFNVYNPAPRTQSVCVNHKSETTEHRAPTDESVRLLKEMEQAARDKLVDVMKIESNKFHAKAYIFRMPASRTLKIRIVFSLNDEKHDFEFDIDESKAQSRESLVKAISSAIALELEEFLTAIVFDHAMKHLI